MRKITLLLLFCFCCPRCYADTDAPDEENYSRFETNTDGSGNDEMTAKESNKVPNSFWIF